MTALTLPAPISRSDPSSGAAPTDVAAAKVAAADVAAADMTSADITAGHPDALLVQRALRGERSAHRALYQRHAPALGAMVTRLLASRTDGEDALHDAFADAFERMHRLRDPAAFGGWLRRIALTRVHRQLRRRRLRQVLGLQHAADATLARLASPSCSPARRAELARIDAVLDRLPAQVRTCWCLARVEGHTLPEIAALTGLSLATVKRRLVAASQAIDAHIGGAS